MISDSLTIKLPRPVRYPLPRVSSRSCFVARQEEQSRRTYVDGQEPCVVGEPSAPAAVAIDHGAIITSVGEVAYEWRLDTDAISWGANLGEVLPLGDQATIASGRGFAQWVETSSGRSRADAVSDASRVEQ